MSLVGFEPSRLPPPSSYEVTSRKKLATQDSANGDTLYTTPWKKSFKLKTATILIQPLPATLTSFVFMCRSRVVGAGGSRSHLMHLSLPPTTMEQGTATKRLPTQVHPRPNLRTKCTVYVVPVRRTKYCVQHLSRGALSLNPCLGGVEVALASGKRAMPMPMPTHRQ